MTGPLLVVALPEAPASRAQAAAMVQACSAALRPGHCELPSDSEEQRATAIAVVSFKGPGRLKALLEVGKRRDDREVWLSEELSFRDNDASIEQYRAIGLTVAVLFHELENGAVRHATGEPSRAETGRPEAAKAPPGTANHREAPHPVAADGGAHARSSGSERTASMPRAWLTAGALAGADPGGRVARFGGEAVLGVAPVRPLLVAVSGHYQRARLAGVDLTFASLGIGVGSGLAISPELRLRVRAEVLAENVDAATRDPVTNLNGHKSLWVSGLSGAVDLVWSPGGFWGVSLSIAPEQLARGTTVTLHDQALGTTSPTSIAAGLGVEIYPLGP